MRLAGSPSGVLPPRLTPASRSTPHQSVSSSPAAAASGAMEVPVKSGDLPEEAMPTKGRADHAGSKSAPEKAAQKAEWARYDTRKSPFLELGTPFTAWEAVKMVLLLPLVIPRLLLMLLALLGLAGMSFVAALNWPLDKPFPPWRRNLVLASRHLAGAVPVLLGFRIKVRGWENLRKAEQLGGILAFNHVSYVDAFVMMWLCAPSGVSRASNADIPLLGTCIKAYQNIYVSRASIDNVKVKAGEPSVAQMIAARARDKRFPLLAMAPEGTTGSGRALLKFRTGAFVPGVPVTAVALDYNRRFHNPAWTIIREPWHLLRLLCQFENRLDVTILEPHVPTEPELADPRLFAANVRALFSQLLRVPMVEQSQEEYVGLMKSGIAVSWDGRRVTAPPGVLGPRGIVDLNAAVLAGQERREKAKRERQAAQGGAK